MTTPETGYEVPQDAIASMRVEPDPAYDPLVAPPQSGIRGWAWRLGATLRRSGGPLLAMLLVTAVVAQVIQFIAQTVLTYAWAPDDVISFLLIADLSSVVALLVTSIGWGAGIWLVTERAAGRPARLDAALATGVRRCPAMFGWGLVLFAPVTAASTLSYQFSGSVLALLPLGLYWGVAGSLVSYAVVYERGATAILRSVVLVHRAFGAALARVLPAVLLYLGGLLVTGWTTTWLWARADPLDGGMFDVPGVWLGTALIGVTIDVLISVPLLVGLLLTYAQFRAREEPLTTAALWAAANRDR